MTETAATRPQPPLAERSDWPLRAWLTAALLAAAGLTVHLVSGGHGLDAQEAWRAALVAAAIVGPLAFAFTFDRGVWRAPLAFAALAALVMAGLAWRTTAADTHYADPEFGFAAGLVAVVLALPLFQAGFHRTRWATRYDTLHEAAWTDALCVAGSLAFTGAAWLLLALMSQLFHLLRIEVLQDLMRQDWFGWVFSGAAFGAALGVLRGETAILGTLQRVAMVVLSILAVPLAAGLALFLGAMVLAGPDVLWQATRSATPILLACAAGAWLLANAIVRDSDAQASASRVLRAAAFVLVIAVLPLTVFAAISLGTRIAQHGLSPERIWGLIAIAVACAYGVAWLVAAVRGARNGAWMGHVRRANVNLALLVGGLALILALPIVDFGAISARDQVARLARGAVSVENFDYAALRWDFGDAGRRALAQLAGGKNVRVAELAREAQAQVQRPMRGFDWAHEKSFELTVQPTDPALEKQVRDYLRANPWACQQRCVALAAGRTPDGRRQVAIVQDGSFIETQLPARAPGEPAVAAPANPPLRPGSKVEVRDVTRRYIFIDGKPLDRPLDIR